MKFLDVRLKSGGFIEYRNKIESDDFRKLSLLLSDLKAYGFPVGKAVEDYLKCQ